MLPANVTAARRPAARFSDAAFLVAAVAAVALVALIASGARSWIDRPFPGFFVLADRTDFVRCAARTEASSPAVTS